MRRRSRASRGGCRTCLVGLPSLRRCPNHGGAGNWVGQLLACKVDHQKCDIDNRRGRSVQKRKAQKRMACDEAEGEADRARPTRQNTGQRSPPVRRATRPTRLTPNPSINEPDRAGGSPRALTLNERLDRSLVVQRPNGEPSSGAMTSGKPSGCMLDPLAAEREVSGKNEVERVKKTQTTSGVTSEY